MNVWDLKKTGPCIFISWSEFNLVSYNINKINTISKPGGGEAYKKPKFWGFESLFIMLFRE